MSNRNPEPSRAFEPKALVAMSPEECGSKELPTCSCRQEKESLSTPKSKPEWLLGLVGLSLFALLSCWGSAVEQAKTVEKKQEGLDVLEKKAAKEPGKHRKSAGYEVVLIPAGTFTMGCTAEQGGDCEQEEKPSHEVDIRQSFYLMKSEVTQGLYQKIMGNNPSVFHTCGKDCPVENVSWLDALSFANKLSEAEGLEACYQSNANGSLVAWSKGLRCEGWRLPTESEWERAARGGQPMKYAGSNELGTVGWYSVNSGSKTHGVCGKSKNGYGLCDMSGNVWEWVWELHGEYKDGSVIDPLGSLTVPQGEASSAYRSIRGGAWGLDDRFSRVSHRSSGTPAARQLDLGFRLCRSNLE